MVMEVLQNEKQISEARCDLVKKAASFIDTPLQSLLRRLKLLGGIKVGDQVKSWDVLSTVEFIEKNIKKEATVLDIGCYASEVLISLHKLGFTNLSGVDLNSSLDKMPYSDSINYVVDNFMSTKFEDSSFDAITSISVIEHGFKSQELLSEMSRLLKPGGFFISSFDYWPEKIDTSEIKFFGMDWLIFSENDVRDFVSQATNYDLMPVGDMNFKGKDRPISCSERDYTFAWMVLKKVTG